MGQEGVKGLGEGWTGRKEKLLRGREIGKRERGREEGKERDR